MKAVLIWNWCVLWVVSVNMKSHRKPKLTKKCFSLILFLAYFSSTRVNLWQNFPSQMCTSLLKSSVLGIYVVGFFFCYFCFLFVCFFSENDKDHLKRRFVRDVVVVCWKFRLPRVCVLILKNGSIIRKLSLTKFSPSNGSFPSRERCVWFAVLSESETKM